MSIKYIQNPTDGVFIVSSSKTGEAIRIFSTPQAAIEFLSKDETVDSIFIEIHNSWTEVAKIVDETANVPTQNIATEEQATTETQIVQNNSEIMPIIPKKSEIMPIIPKKNIIIKENNIAKGYKVIIILFLLFVFASIFVTSWWLISK